MGQATEAIVDSGNICTDLICINLLRSQTNFSRYVVGIDPDAEGMTAGALGLQVSAEGAGCLVTIPTPL